MQKYSVARVPFLLFFLFKTTMFNNGILKTVQVLMIILAQNWCLSQCRALQSLSVLIASQLPSSIKPFTVLPGCCLLCRTPFSNHMKKFSLFAPFRWDSHHLTSFCTIFVTFLSFLESVSIILLSITQKWIAWQISSTSIPYCYSCINHFSAGSYYVAHWGYTRHFCEITQPGCLSVSQIWSELCESYVLLCFVLLFSVKIVGIGRTILWQHSV